MDSTAQAVSNASPMSYDEWLRSDSSSALGTANGDSRSLLYGDNLLAKFGNLFSGSQTAAKDMYNKYVEGVNKANEERALANARSYNEWYDSTKYQRAVDDLKKAGLNPWLALNSGLGTQSASSATNSSARGIEYSIKEEKSIIGALLGAIAKVISA